MICLLHNASKSYKIGITLKNKVDKASMKLSGLEKTVTVYIPTDVEKINQELEEL